MYSEPIWFSAASTIFIAYCVLDSSHSVSSLRAETPISIVMTWSFVFFSVISRVKYITFTFPMKRYGRITYAQLSSVRIRAGFTEVGAMTNIHLTFWR